MANQEPVVLSSLSFVLCGEKSLSKQTGHIRGTQNVEWLWDLLIKWHHMCHCPVVYGVQFLHVYAGLLTKWLLWLFRMEALLACGGMHSRHVTQSALYPKNSKESPHNNFFHSESSGDYILKCGGQCENISDFHAGNVSSWFPNLNHTSTSKMHQFQPYFHINYSEGKHFQKHWNWTLENLVTTCN